MKIARGRVVLNFEKMILSMVIRGTARKAQAIPQRVHQKIREKIITKGLILSLSPISLGSIKFPIKVCCVMRQRRTRKGI